MAYLPSHELVDGVLSGDARSIARMLTRAENGADEARAALDRLYARAGRAHVVGVTGVPGSGKSTLVAKLAAAIRRSGRTVAIVAVDPSSPYSGGAILGDRIRMADLAGDPGVWVRSMATRGALGGLARGTLESVDVLDAAGYDIVIIETVGVGQDEVDVARAAHTTVGVCVKQGPDGSIFFTDWSDTGECHNYDDATIQRDNGRIYRIKHGNSPAVPEDISKLTGAQLTLWLVASDQVRASQARRILQERAAAGKLGDVERKAILALVTSPKVTRQTARLQGIWAAHSCGLLTEPVLLELMSDSDDTIRGWAVRLELEDRDASPAVMTRLIELAQKDSSSYVRLQLAAGLQRLTYSRREGIASALVSHAEDASDNNLVLMDWYGIEPLIGGSDEEVLRLAVATKIPKLRQFIARHLGAHETPRFAPVIRWLEESAIDPATQKDILVGVHTALEGRRNIKANEGWAAIAPRFTNNSDPAIRELGLKISLVQGSDDAFEQLIKVARNDRLELPQRERALAALVTANRPSVADLLLGLLDDSQLRGTAIRGLAGYDREQSAGAILARYSKLNDSEKLDAISTLTAREKSALALRPLLLQYP